MQKGGKYFYSKNDGLQNQSVLYVADSYKAEGRVLIDPNKWSKDGTIALSSYGPSDDGRLPGVYARSEAGSDWQQIHVIDVETGKQLDDPLKWVRFDGDRLEQGRQRLLLQPLSRAAAGREASGRGAEPDDLLPQAGHEARRRPARLSPARSSRLELLASRASDDGKYLVLNIARSTDPQNQVLVRDASAAADAPFKELIGDFDNQFSFLGNEGTKFYFLTDLDAPTKRIVTMDIEQPGPRAC